MEAKTMKLCYRGIPYDYTPPEVETASSDLVGTYRGIDVRFRNPKKPLVLQPTLDLKYRGVAYRTNGETAETEQQPAVRPETVPAPVAADVAPEPEVTVSLQQRMRELMLKGEVATRQRQQTMLNRLASEVGVNVDVDEYWRQFHRFVDAGDRATYGPSAVAVS
ncbi:Glutamine synthetase inactivating factor IF7 [Geitlerinema sp. FC II]|nr:Glutamine synthetase inactivating factor IF7 [Geitlerinema sp. FC II]